MFSLDIQKQLADFERLIKPMKGAIPIDQLIRAYVTEAIKKGVCTRLCKP